MTTRGGLALVLAAALAAAAGTGCAKKDGAHSAGADSAAADAGGVIRFERTAGAEGDTTKGYARYTLVMPRPDRVPGVSALSESLRAAIAWSAAEGVRGADGRPVPVDTVAARFLADYADYRTSFPDAPQEWFVDREIRLETLPFGLATIRVSDARYQGGAHGMAGVHWTSFDPASGARMRLGDVADAAGLDSLTRIGEAEFRAVRGVPPGQTLTEAGFWFEDGRFTLPDNFGATRGGLVFQWNGYDVGPWSLGPTEVTLPWTAVAPHVRADGPLKLAK